MDGLVKQTFEKVKRMRPIVDAKRKHVQLEREYIQTYRDVGKQIRAFVKQVCKDTGLTELGRKVRAQKAAYIRVIKRTMIKTSPLTAGAFAHVPGWKLEWLLNGSKWRRRIRRGYFVHI